MTSSQNGDVSDVAFVVWHGMAWLNRFQVRDQEDAEQREARLATDRDHHALVRFVYCLQPSSGQNMSAVVNDIALPEKQSLSFAQPHASRLR